MIICSHHSKGSCLINNKNKLEVIYHIILKGVNSVASKPPNTILGLVLPLCYKNIQFFIIIILIKPKEFKFLRKIWVAGISQKKFEAFNQYPKIDHDET